MGSACKINTITVAVAVGSGSWRVFQKQYLFRKITRLPLPTAAATECRNFFCLTF
jgi:hypothetical protein